MALSAARFFSAGSAAARPAGSGAAGVCGGQAETGSDGSGVPVSSCPGPAGATANRSRSTRWTPEIRSRAANVSGGSGVATPKPICPSSAISSSCAGGGWK